VPYAPSPLRRPISSTLNLVSCVLRITTNVESEQFRACSLEPYRVERGTAHYMVSARDFNDLPGQVQDAIAFLGAKGSQVRSLLSVPGARGVLDFAVEVDTSQFRFASLPSELVQKAGLLGLALELSQYPKGENGC